MSKYRFEWDCMACGEGYNSPVPTSIWATLRGSTKESLGNFFVCVTYWNSIMRRRRWKLCIINYDVEAFGGAFERHSGHTLEKISVYVQPNSPRISEGEIFVTHCVLILTTYFESFFNGVPFPSIVNSSPSCFFPNLFQVCNGHIRYD